MKVHGTDGVPLASRIATAARGKNRSKGKLVLSINSAQLATLADHIHARRGALLEAWQRAIKRDPKLTDGDALPRSELLDHIPALLDAYEQALRRAASAQGAEAAGEGPAAAHGLQRWSQGYGLREVTRELGKLNGCVILEIDAFGSLHSDIAADTLMHARQAWAALCCSAIETSVNQYFELAQEEAEGQVKGLEAAVEEIQALERQRGDLWREAAHDLRNNLGLVANASVGLTRQGQDAQRGDGFLRILMRGITSLHQLLDDVTGLARLQAGREVRQLEPLDASTILLPLCDTIRPLALQRGLYLNTDGAPGLAADGDAVKIRRIAQNLILNAVKYTNSGGVSVRWGECGPSDPKRWQLVIQDTGPGFLVSHSPLTALIPDPAVSNVVTMPQSRSANDETSAGGKPTSPLHRDAGEGIGLSIVKRLCDMLDASIEMESVDGVGTTFRVLFPKHYAG